MYGENQNTFYVQQLFFLFRKFYRLWDNVEMFSSA